MTCPETGYVTDLCDSCEAAEVAERVGRLRLCQACAEEERAALAEEAE